MYREHQLSVSGNKIQLLRSLLIIEILGYMNHGKIPVDSIEIYGVLDLIGRDLDKAYREESSIEIKEKMSYVLYVIEETKKFIFENQKITRDSLINGLASLLFKLVFSFNDLIEITKDRDENAT